MRRIALIAAAAGALAVPMPAVAASPASECEAAGGEYQQAANGTKDCVFPVGNSDNTKVTSQKGSFNSSHDEGYTNPGGSQPPGQQGGNDIGK
jgi:hypothetical protein